MYDKNKFLKIFIKKYIVILFFIINIALITNLCNNKILIGISFFVNLIIITYILNILTSEKNMKPMLATFFVFFYCYMFLTPMCQVNYGIFPNTIRYNEKLIIQGNMIIFIFMIIYIFSYKFSRVKPFGYYKINDYIDEKFLNYMLILCIVITICLSKDIVMQLLNLGNGESFGSDEVSQALIKRVLFMIPLGYTFYVISYYKKIKNKRRHLFFSIILSILYFNPLMQKRNSLGPILLSIFFYFTVYKNYKKGNFKYALINIFALLVLFPCVKIFTHDYYFYDIDTIIQRIKDFSLYKEFIWLDFDAYSNFLATILYIKEFGFTFGKQILSTVLFFIPRKLWPGKAESTGIFIGNYLMEHHSMWFNNLSNPIVSEFYIDFGIIGLIIFTFIFGLAAKKVDISTKNNFGKILSLYISMYMIFFMRGALMPVVAYLVGPLVAILLPIYLYKSLKK